MKKNIGLYYPVKPNCQENKLTKIVEAHLGVHLKYDYDALLVILMHATALSISEILGLCPFVSGTMIRKHIKRLKDKGYAEVWRFTSNKVVAKENPRRERQNVVFDESRQFIGLTKKGVKHLKELGIDTSNAFVIRKDISIQHSYATGYNLVEMMKLPCFLNWYKEAYFYYDRDSNETVSKVYRSDADCVVTDNNTHRYFLHIEQDMCTENIPVLVDKCNHYIRGELMNRREDVLIFSVWADVSARVGCFSPKYFKELIGMVDLCRAETAYKLVERAEFWADQAGLQEIISVYDDYYGKGALTLSCLKKILEKLSSGYEPVQRAYINYEQSRRAFKRMYSFIKAVCQFSRVSDSPCERPDKYTLASSLLCLNAFYGNQFIFVPTTLISKKMPYIIPSMFGGMAEQVCRTVSRYFDKLTYVSEFTAPLFNTFDIGGFSGNSYPVCLRNEFAYERHGIKGRLCVEFMSFDAGAWFRAMLLDLYIQRVRRESLPEMPLVLLMIFDNEYQQTKFYRTGNYGHTWGLGLGFHAFNMVFLYSSELGDPEAMMRTIAYVDKNSGETADVRLPKFD